MIRLGRQALLAALILLAACQGKAFEPGDVRGEWEVADVYCRSCESVSRSDIGKTLRLTDDTAIDQIEAGICSGKVGYREVSSTRELRENTVPKLNPVWPGAKASEIRWISVTCRDMDFVLLMVLPDGSLGYASEGEISYRLVRRAGH